MYKNGLPIILANFARRIARFFEKKANTSLFKNHLRSEFSALLFSSFALQKLIDDYKFSSVLDIGCGNGNHVEIFKSHQKNVTAIDYGESVYFKNNTSGIATIVANFNDYNFTDKFDCVWCSHVLEHQLDSHQFLLKLHSILKEDGCLAITVPPLKSRIVGGHVSLWNMGLLLYRLVLAGFDCTDAIGLKYGYNISIILKKRSIQFPSDIEYDSGDIRKLRKFLPRSIAFSRTLHDDSFDGDIINMNWFD
jgi:SAM-dependent methyltransferase